MLVLKLTGAIAVIAAAVLCAAVMKRRLCGRARLLRLIERDCVHIKSALEYSSPTLVECFLGCNCVFDNAAKLMTRGVSPEKAIMRAAQNEPLLCDEERKVLENFAKGLGIEDIGGQAANIALLISRMGQLAQNAENENAQRGRLCVAGSICSALVFVIILL